MTAAARHGRVVMALMFFPRGGAAHVTRALAERLPEEGWDVTLVSGSLSLPGRPGDAGEFFGAGDVRPVDFTASVSAPDPLAAEIPHHPSYEDRPGAPDRVFAGVDDALYEHQVALWSDALAEAGAAQADVLHLHHLTPVNEAAARVAPHVPVFGHVHGTELLMLERIAEGVPEWEFAEAWGERMRAWAAAWERFVVSTEAQGGRACRLLGVDPARAVVLPNGFDPETFRPRSGGAAPELDRRAHWRAQLVEEPRGWRPGEEAGSVAYAEEELEALGDGTVFLYVGRFTAVKRIGLLVRAFAEARETLSRTAALVLLGGFPGEWEGEHPLELAEKIGARDVFLAGWHGHDALPDFFAASDVLVLPSVREQFGQVLVEGMACGLPAIAANAHGPAEIVRDGETGWLVEPDDGRALRDALVAAAQDDDDRARRGRAAREDACARFAWPALAARLARAYEAAEKERAAGPRHAPPSPP